MGSTTARTRVREVEEETGYTVRLDGLLTVDSIHFVEGSADHTPPR